MAFADPLSRPASRGLASADLAAAGLAGRWGWFVALGVLFLAIGCIAAFDVVAATVVSVLYFGVMLVVGGLAQMVHAFQVRGGGRVAFWLISGLVYAAAGIIAIVNPLMASAVLTLLLAAALLAAGLVRIWAGLQSRPHEGWGFVVLTGIVTALVGLLIFTGWPLSSLVLLGTILAIDFLVQGVGFLAFGLALRRRHRA